MSEIFALPDIVFASTDVREITDALITGYEEVAQARGIADYKLYDGDPRRLFLFSLAAVLVAQRANIDLAAKSNLLRYAGEDTIGDLGLLYGRRGARLPAAAARTTLRYTLSAARSVVTTIPTGFRVTAGDNLMFATIELLDIPAGALYGDVSAECVRIGVIGNGIAPGAITTIVDRLPFISAVANLTVTEGGSDQEGIEAYRNRLYVLPESFSTAGPVGAYEFWAKSASPAIADVAVLSPEPGVVQIIPVLSDGRLPTQDILDLVYETCNDRTVRPLTDQVIVSAPTECGYDVDLTYYIAQGSSWQSAAIQAKVNDAVNAFCLWQGGAMGRDINPSHLIRMVQEAGVKRVEITAPKFAIVPQSGLAICGVRTVRYGGIEDA